jgi:hypothetical protein
MKRILMIVTWIIALIFFSCGVFDSERIIEGEVFVVTRGGENIALGLVDIAFIEADEFTGILKEKAEIFDLEVVKLQNGIKDRMTKITELEELEKANWDKVVAEGKSKKKSDYLGDYWDKKIHFEGTKKFINESKDKRRSRIYVKGNQEYYRNKFGLKTIDEYASTLREIDNQNDLFVKEMQELEQFLQGEALVEMISKQYSSARTNSEGKFEGLIKKRKDYIIVAKGSREVGNEKEVYLWALPIAKGKADVKNVFLSNDNLSTIDEIKGLLPNSNL